MGPLLWSAFAFKLNIWVFTSLLLPVLPGFRTLHSPQDFLCWQMSNISEFMITVQNCCACIWQDVLSCASMYDLVSVACNHKQHVYSRWQV